MNYNLKEFYNIGPCIETGVRADDLKIGRKAVLKMAQKLLVQRQINKRQFTHRKVVQRQIVRGWEETNTSNIRQHPY